MPIFYIRDVLVRLIRAYAILDEREEKIILVYNIMYNRAGQKKKKKLSSDLIVDAV